MSIPNALLNAPIEKLEYLALLQKKLEQQEMKLEEYKKANPIEFFSPNPPQLDVLIAWLNPKYKTFTYTGGNRRGKTTIETHIGIITMIGYIPYKLESVNNEGVVIKSWDDTYEEIKQWEGKTWELMWKDGKPLVKIIFSHDMPRLIRYIGQGWSDHVKDVVIPELKKWWPANRKVTIRKNGDGLEVYWTDVESQSYLRIMSTDQPVKKFEGKQDDVLLFDEPLPRSIYVALARGLVDRDGKEFFAMTLLKDEPWIHREVIKRLNDDGSPDLSVYNNDGTIYDNLKFGLKSEDSIDNFKKKLRPDEIDSRIYGKPGYLSGLIYGVFSRQLHVKEKFRVPLDWIVDIAIDPHPATQQAVMFLATDTRGFKYVVDEIWEFADPKSLGEMIVTKIRFNGYRVENYVLIEPHAKDDTNNTETVFNKIENVLVQHNLYLEPAEQYPGCVDDGITVTKDWLMSQNKMPALFIFNNCVRTIYEIEGYVWDHKTGKPIDKDDHMMENLRRLIALGTEWSEPVRRKKDIGSNVSWACV